MSPWTERLIADATAKSPWLSTPYRRGRANICRALRIDPTDPTAGYATAPFVVIDHDGETWIAGAVGFTVFSHGEIADLILWQPQTQRIRIFGEAANAAILITPFQTEPELTVFADGFAFFRAWADRRAAFYARRQAARETMHAIIPTEPADGNLPGALVVGNLDKIQWRDTGASTLLAGPGVDPKTLQRAVLRSARIPRVAAAPDYLRSAA